ncbi:efflux RND transporter periplasmic adaptor subunit [Leptolyngbya sp. FACHB-36]|uniref:efflux RND transporter periplasmic adaptor subunit n=1 Tax=Leptolyngbya sp. FACHB-36 TaxID=2692808 RepID=UPI001680C5C1|nr:efflux RND transporter periplasmic adaptor subunit [Leptolyngbya sp. FACHB-36]MBD2019150.1 efflux RND transporter periplasmic adaptor subunit [Leptolyngbya sp. FACHB-36]
MPPSLNSRHYLLGTALVLTALTTGCRGKDPAATASGPPPVAVTIQAIGSGTLQESSEFVGTLEAKERVNLRPQIAGRVERILARQGDVVTAGMPILQLRPERNQASVQAAVSGVDAQRATLANSTAGVKAAEAEVARRSADIQRLQAELRSRNADVKLAQVNYSRAQTLVAEGASARQSLDERTQQINAATAARDAATQSLEVARKDLAAAQAQLAGTRATVQQSQSQLQRTQAELAVQVEDLNYNRVVAPIVGIVGDIPTRVGDYVNVGDTLTSIIQNDELDLRISVPIARQAQLRSGLTVELLDPNSGKRLRAGRLTFIAPQVNTQEQSILTKARFPNRDQQLRDGQFVRARLIWNQRPGILVPTVAVSRVGAQDFVYVAETESKDGKSRQVARQKPVKLGTTQGQQYQVISGIKSGDQLITSGIQSLTDGAAIQLAQMGEKQASRQTP